MESIYLNVPKGRLDKITRDENRSENGRVALKLEVRSHRGPKTSTYGFVREGDEWKIAWE